MPLNLANPAWVDAEPDLNAAHRRGQAAEDAQGRRPGRAGGAGQPAAPGAAGPQPAAVEDACLRGPGATADGRKRVALYTQLHHAAVDGQAAVALANALLDLTPQPRTIELRPSRRPHLQARHDRDAARRAGQPGAEGGRRSSRACRPPWARSPAAGQERCRRHRAAGRQEEREQPDAGPGHALQRVGDHRARLCGGDAAAARAQGAGRRTAPRSTTWC
jgi:hypothetical protein